MLILAEVIIALNFIPITQNIIPCTLISYLIQVNQNLPNCSHLSQGGAKRLHGRILSNYLQELLKLAKIE
jgi:hypothetical protein